MNFVISHRWYHAFSADRSPSGRSRADAAERFGSRECASDDAPRLRPVGSRVQANTAEARARSREISAQTRDVVVVIDRSDVRGNAPYVFIARARGDAATRARDGARGGGVVDVGARGAEFVLARVRVVDAVSARAVGAGDGDGGADVDGVLGGDGERCGVCGVSGERADDGVRREIRGRARGGDRVVRAVEFWDDRGR